jgi:hypothetical protein
MPITACISATGENDIYGLFCTAQKAGAHFLVPPCVDRLAGDGAHTIGPGENALNFPSAGLGQADSAVGRVSTRKFIRG